jgi:DNA repair photolyase
MRQVANPKNPFDSQHRELLEPPARVVLQVYEETSRGVLTRNESPDLPFRWSLNPYQGCFHACAYCYARPTHEYWGFGAGTDFESKLVIKPDAPSLLRTELMKPSWTGDLIAFSGNTDCYQPLEASYGLTRACLEVCAEFRNPVAIVTKGALIIRDLDVLQRLKTVAWVRVYISIPFADDRVARKVEPQAPSISRRLETMQQLADAGIPTAVLIAPIIPGLNEADIPVILDQAKRAGARSAAYALLRLPGSVQTVFLERMAEAFPDRVEKIVSRIRDVRGGKLTESRFFHRHEGRGAYWRMIQQLFAVSSKRVGFPVDEDRPIPHTFRRPVGGQLPLFPELG